MGNHLMWVWWALTVGICAWKIGEGFWRPHRMLEWPFLACTMWAYFYGYMAYDAQIYLSAYLGNGLANMGQLMALLCLVAILIGWNLGIHGKIHHPPDHRVYPYFRLWLAGFIFLLLGTAGGYSVMRAANSGTLDYQDSSAYWYLFFYVGYPGLAMAVWALFKMDPKLRVYLWIVTLLDLAAFIAPYLINARRGPLYPAIMVLLLVPPLARRRSPNPLLFFGGLMAVGLAMLVFLQVRFVTYNGGTWKEAIQRLDLNAAIQERSKQADDNEFVNNCQLIGTIYQNGKYQYGTGHLELLIHWVPRKFWKDKPTLGEGLYSFDEMFDDMEVATGFHLLGTGGAVSGVSDTFVQYGFFCPIFWLFLSWGFGAIYLRARTRENPVWLFSYVGFICASHWLVSQSLPAAFVPGVCFQTVPLVVLWILARPQVQHRASTAKRRRNGSPQAQPIAS